MKSKSLYYSLFIIYEINKIKFIIKVTYAIKNNLSQINVINQNPHEIKFNCLHHINLFVSSINSILSQIKFIINITYENKFSCLYHKFICLLY